MKKVVYTCISGQYEEKYNSASTYERLLLQNKKGTY